MMGAIHMSHPTEQQATIQFQRLLEVMRRLREPGGCAWDREQTHESMKKYVREEGDEVIAAIEEGDPLHICEELGDLLMIITFHARIAEETGKFTMNEVAKGIVEKLISRHPHVFPPNAEEAEAGKNLSSDGVVQRWQELKTEEKRLKKRVSARMEHVAGFASSLQASLQMQEEARKVGFDFPDHTSALAKIVEEANELSHLCKNRSEDREQLTLELGDLLFSVVNCACMLGIDPDVALRKTNQKFLRRFSSVEERVEAAGGWEGKGIQELDRLWDAVKAEERQKSEP